MLNGLFTNVGFQKAIEAANSEGIYIKPKKFAVSEILGDLDASRTLDDINATWFQANISGYVVVNPNAIILICTVPPNVVDDPRYTKEIYIIGVDEDDNEYLMAISQPTVDLVYDPEGELKLRVTLKTENMSIDDLYVFQFTQAQEVDDHNNDPLAHPLIRTAIRKAGIVTQQADHAFVGQNFDQYPVKAPNVIDMDVVYYNQINNRYERALGSSTTIGNGAGIYIAALDTVVFKGVIALSHSTSPYTKLYASATTPGQISLSPSQLQIGYTLQHGLIMVDFVKSGVLEEIDPDGDVSVTLAPATISELVLTDEDDVNWEVFVSNAGVLFTEQTVKGATPKVKFTKLDASFAEIKVDTDGSLFIQSPPDSLSVLTNDTYYLQSEDGTCWKFSVSLIDEVIMLSYNNKYRILSDSGQVMFGVQQVATTIGFTGIQTVEETGLDGISESTFASELGGGLTYLIVQKIGTIFRKLMHFNGSRVSKLAGYAIGDTIVSTLNLAQFQSHYDTTWVSCNGADVTGSDLEVYTGVATVPNSPTDGTGLNRYVKINY